MEAAVKLFRKWLEEGIAGVTEVTCNASPVREGEMVLGTLTEDHQKMHVFLGQACDELRTKLNKICLEYPLDSAGPPEEIQCELELEGRQVEMMRHVMTLEIRQYFGLSEDEKIGVRENFQLVKAPPEPGLPETVVADLLLTSILGMAQGGGALVGIRIHQ